MGPAGGRSGDGRLLLAKWASSAATLLLIAGVVVVAVWSRGPGQLARALLLPVAGLAATLLAVQLFLVPLTRALPQMLAATRSVAQATNNPVSLLELYARVDGSLVRQVLVANAGLAAAIVVAGLVRGRWPKVVAGALGALFLGQSVVRLVRLGALTGGTGNLKLFREPMVLVVLATLALAVAVALRDLRAGRDQRSSIGRTNRTELAVLVTLCALPLAQALGTGNGLLPIAVCAFAGWTGVVVMVATGVERAGWPARGLAAVLAAGAVAVPAVIGVTGVWSHPYRTAAHDQATVALSSVPALDSLRVSAPEAARLAGVRQRLAAYVEPAGRYMMGYDEMSGLVLALGGRPVGEAWYSATDHRRTATAIAAQCPRGVGPWGRRLPLVLTVRTLQPVDRSALLACHLDLARDYRLLPLQDVFAHLVVYVPLRDDSAPGDGQ